MTKIGHKSAAQTLFDRLLVTWIYPELGQRAEEGLLTLPVDLKMALVVCRDRKSHKVFLNDEARANLASLEVATKQPPKAGQVVYDTDVVRLVKVGLVDSLRRQPFIFLLRGDESKYYVLSRRMARIVGNREFEVLAKIIAKEGVVADSSTQELTVYIDLLRNQYAPLKHPALKRKVVLEFAQMRLAAYRGKATACVKRHLRLPALLLFPEDEFLPLLLEVRETYADGYFFSCIAGAATTADRICNRLSSRYGLAPDVQCWFLGETLGNKIPRLRAEGVIMKEIEKLLLRINRIRNRHLHPRRTISELSMKRDALLITRLLHEVLEGTFSIYRDHTFAQGRIVPKPFV